MSRMLRRLGWAGLADQAKRWTTGAWLFLLLAVAAYAANTAFLIRAWQIDGVDGALREQVEAILHKSSPSGFLGARPVSVCRAILDALPDISDCQARREMPGRLFLDLAPSQPIAMWESPDGLMLVDARGRPYRPMSREDGVDAPLLRASRDDLGQAVEILHVLARQGDRWLPNLSECVATDASWHLLFDRSQRWLLPKTGVVLSRVERLGKLLQSKRWRTDAWQVDARLDGRWFVRHGRSGGVI